VEGDTEPGLAVLQQVAEAGVGLGGRPEAGVLAHRPGPPAVHGRVDAAGEGVLARLPQGRPGVEPGQIRGPVDHLHRDVRLGEPLVARRWSSASPLTGPTGTNGPRRRSGSGMRTRTRDVEQGRDELNFSTWDEDDGEDDDAAEAVAEGSMPPR